MKYWTAPIIILSMVLGLLGCGGMGGYEDVALIAQAERALTRIRNSLEEYHLDHDSYPGEEADLKELLAPYFFRVVFNEGKEIATHFLTITSARNRLAQVRELLTEYETEMQVALTGTREISKLRELLQEIQRETARYEGELGEGKMDSPPQYPGESFEKLMEILTGFNSNQFDECLVDSLLALGDSSISMLKGRREAMEESLEDSLKRKAIGPHIEAADSAWLSYREELLGTGSEEVEFSPEVEITALKDILPEGDTLLPPIEQSVIDYRRMELRREALPSFQKARWRVKRAREILKGYEDKLREGAKKASIIVKAQEELKRMAEAIEAYRVERGAYPRDGQDLDRLLQEESADSMPEEAEKAAYALALDHLAGPPIYSTSDPTNSFRLEAEVNDKDRTSIFCDVEMVNEWNEVVATFSQYPVYTTPDSTLNYFLRARANDTNKTPLSARPAVVREAKKEKGKRR